MTCVSTIILGHIILIFYLTCLILISTNRHHFTVIIILLFLARLVSFLFCLSVIILPVFSIHPAPLCCCCFCYSVYSCCCLSFVRVNFIYELLGRIVNQLFSMEASCLPRRILPSDFVTRGSCIIRREAIQRLAAQSMTFSEVEKLMESVNGHRTI